MSYNCFCDGYWARASNSPRSLCESLLGPVPVTFLTWRITNTIECEVLLSFEIFCFICVYHFYQLTETIQLLAEDILERRQETTRLHRCLCKLAGKVTNVFFRLYELQSTLCKKDICRTGTKCLSSDDVTRDDSQRRFVAQHSVATLLRHCFEWLQHCPNIAAMCCAKNRRCESSRVK